MQMTKCKRTNKVTTLSSRYSVKASLVMHLRVTETRQRRRWAFLLVTEIT